LVVGAIKPLKAPTTCYHLFLFETPQELAALAQLAGSGLQVG
jgi:hypothetical protein